ncbi:MAG: NapC/NirT family cytochrome c [Bacteroidota bacterium]
MKRRLPDAFYNPLSIGGAILSGVSFLTIVFLTVVDQVEARPPAYIGIISYVILPIPLLFGLFVVAMGVVRERRRVRRGKAASRLQYSLDLTSPRQRSAVLLIATTAAILLLFSSYGSYRAFEWTESVQFCGTTCHTVMEPEYTAYQHSPHARVKCVDCHVGSGASWYVRSKLSGAYQVYAVLANVYPRPIPTPIHNPRPAQETCEQCHWPSHFSGDKEIVNTYFRSDDKNTRWTIALLMKIGGGNTEVGQGRGIHWHMNIANEITFVATDSLRQNIPWVRMRNRTTGEEMEYTAKDAGLSEEEIQKLPKNTMDCIDCHNRPSHVYRPPVRIVDELLATNQMSPSIPGIRAIAVNALVQPFTTAAAATDSIPIVVQAALSDKLGTIPDTLRPLIASASTALVGEYHRNFFPYMHADWRSYPNNIGHMTDLGCFRCHDGNHVSSTGKVIPKDCNTCHTILYQGTDPVPGTLSSQGEAFRHPEDVGDAWMTTQCKECHTGQ